MTLARGVLLDLTRLASRLNGHPLSGIDRVELAWLRHLLHLQKPVFGLVKLRSRQFLLNRESMTGLSERFQDGHSDPPGWPWSILPPKTATRARALATLSQTALGSARRPEKLASLLSAFIPAGTVYLNLSHSNLEAANLATILILMQGGDFDSSSGRF